MTPQQGKPLSGPLCSIPGRRLAYSVYCWLLFCFVLVVVGALIVLWPGSRTRRRRIARSGARLLFRSARIPLCIEGLDRLPERPHILVANHSSFLDALILTAALPASPGYAFVARQEFRSQAILWPILRAVGTVILHPHVSHAAPPNIERLGARLENGDNLVIFPEGAIARTPGIRPFHSGTFVIAARHGIPIVLAGIRGARKALPLKTWQPVRTPITVVVHTVWEFAGDDARHPELMAQAARETIAQLVGEDLISASCSEP